MLLRKIRNCCLDQSPNQLAKIQLLKREDKDLVTCPVEVQILVFNSSNDSSQAWRGVACEILVQDKPLFLMDPFRLDTNGGPVFSTTNLGKCLVL